MYRMKMKLEQKNCAAKENGKNTTLFASLFHIFYKIAQFALSFLFVRANNLTWRASDRGHDALLPAVMRLVKK